MWLPLLLVFVCLARGSASCVPCCGTAQMTNNMTITGSIAGVRMMDSDSKCQVQVFGTKLLRSALRDKWLYFVGDSSTRGLVLALFYELTNSKTKLKNLTPQDNENEAGFARSMLMFKYGDAKTRAECKQTLVDLKRGFRHGLDDCDDFGDPCSPLPVAALNGANEKSEEKIPFFVGDSVKIIQNKMGDVEQGALIAGLTGEIEEMPEETPEQVIVLFTPKGRERIKISVPIESLIIDVEQENLRRCKTMRGSTHSIASLHIGFLDAIVCEDEVKYIKMSPHDYREGHMRAPMGAQSFPPELHQAQAQTAGEGCVRVTYRMMPETRVFYSELQLYVAGDPNFDKSNVEDTREKTYEGVPRPASSYFKAVLGGVPDVVYFQGGAWDRAMGCLSRSSYAQYTTTIATILAQAAPESHLILATLPTGSAYPAYPQAEMKRLADHEKEERQKSKVVQCLKFLHSDTLPGVSSEEHMLNRLKLATHHAKSWIFDRGVTMQALPKNLYEFESWQDTTTRRLHPIMLHNVWDVHRLVTALSVSDTSGIECPCSSFMKVNNPKACSPSQVMLKGDADWPIGYPKKGRLQHWAVPCDFDVIANVSTS